MNAFKRLDKRAKVRKSRRDISIHSFTADEFCEICEKDNLLGETLRRNETQRESVEPVDTAVGAHIRIRVSRSAMSKMRKSKV